LLVVGVIFDVVILLYVLHKFVVELYTNPVHVTLLEQFEAQAKYVVTTILFIGGIPVYVLLVYVEYIFDGCIP